MYKYHNHKNWESTIEPDLNVLLNHCVDMDDVSLENKPVDKLNRIKTFVDKLFSKDNVFYGYGYNTTKYITECIEISLNEKSINELLTKTLKDDSLIIIHRIIVRSKLRSITIVYIQFREKGIRALVLKGVEIAKRKFLIDEFLKE